MDYTYTYLLWTLIFGLVWLVLFWMRKDARHEILLISSIFGLGGIASQYFYIIDYWQPPTITGTAIGIEDFLIGFFIGGVASVVYIEIYGKKLKAKSKKHKNNLRHIDVLILFLILFFGSLYVLKSDSAFATILAFTVSTAYMLVQRRDLVVNSLVSGILLLLIGSVIYIVLEYLQPGFIKEYWFLKGNWYDMLVLGIPLSEYIWYFLAGAFIGPLYEYTEQRKMAKMHIK